MLSDIELFIVTWCLAGVAFLVLLTLAYSSGLLLVYEKNQRATKEVSSTTMRLSKDRALVVKYLSILILSLISVVGTYISVVNWTPVHDNYDTAIFRVLSTPMGVYPILLIMGVLLIFCSNKESNNDVPKSPV